MVKSKINTRIPGNKRKSESNITQRAELLLKESRKDDAAE